MTTITAGDVAAMIREAARRGASNSQVVIDALVTPGGGNLQAAEDVLAVAALAEVLRYRVEKAAQGTPGMAQALVRLHRYVGDVLAVAEAFKAKEGEVVRG